MKLMISFDVTYITFRQQIHSIQNSVQLVMRLQFEHEMVKAQLTKFTQFLLLVGPLIIANRIKLDLNSGHGSLILNLAFCL